MAAVPQGWQTCCINKRAAWGHMGIERVLLRSPEFCLNETRDLAFLIQAWNNCFCLLSSMVGRVSGGKSRKETS